MGRFDYYAPLNLAEARQCLQQNKNSSIAFLAGGTDLLNQLRENWVEPEVVIDLSRIHEMRGIKVENDEIVVGALATFTEIIESALMKNNIPLLVEACREVGSPQIRNRGTIGGNIANASPAADAVPPLMVLEAKVIIKGTMEERVVALQDVLAGVNQNTLVANEFITEVRFKKPNQYTRSGFIKLGRRAALAISRISMAALLEYTPDYQKITKARIALGSVAKNPFRANKVEQYLEQADAADNQAGEACVEMISELVAESLGTRASAPFKRESIKGLARELLQRLMNEPSR